MEGPSVRRSGRARVPNRKYANDIRDFSPDPELVEQLSKPVDDSDKDADFSAETALAEEAAEEEEQEGEDDEVTQSDESDSSIQTPVGENNTDIVSKVSELIPKPKEFGSNVLSKHNRQFTAKSKPKLAEDSHIRGHPFNEKATSTRNQVLLLAGNDQADVSALRSSIAKWANEISVPKQTPNSNGAGGMAHHPLYTAQVRLAEVEESCKWYGEGGGKALMRNAQRVQSLEPEDYQQYYPKRHDEQRFLHGPYDAQAMYAARPMQPAPLHLTWNTGSSAVQEAFQGQHRELSHHGWLLSLGARPRRLAWAPHRSGDKQYLAISTSKNPPSDQQNLSVFVPMGKYAACIQIWAFAASKIEDGYRSMDSQVRPQLVHAICSDWGSAKELSWNPAACDHEEQEDQIRLGLLAGIWSDGFVRVLDVWTSKESSDYHQAHVKYNGAAFAARPASTVCTCLSWITPSKIAVGCASGQVRLWNVASAITTLASEQSATTADGPYANGTDDPHSAESRAISHGPKPYFCQYLHVSYILSIVSTYPTRPHFIVTASIDGYTRLTDLRHPHADWATTPRARIASPPLAFSPHADCVLSPEDSQGVRTVPLRRFFSVSSVARVDGQVMALATSPVHSSLLVAGSDGSVVAVNPLRRLMSPKGSRYWQQIWFRHEWVPNDRLKLPAPEAEPEQPSGEPPRSDEGRMDVDEGSVETRRESLETPGIADRNEAEAPQGNETSQPELRAGIVRITEGYKLQPYTLIRGIKPQEPGTAFVNPRIKPQTKRKDKKKSSSKEEAGVEGQAATVTDQQPSEPLENPQAVPAHSQGVEECGDQVLDITDDQPTMTENDQSSRPGETATSGAAENLDPALEDGNADVAIAMENGATSGESGAAGANASMDGGAAGVGDATGEAGDEADSEEEPNLGALNFLTIYEEEQAITCLAWCPAVECGGWAAAGMGSGLLRVEDIAI